MGESIEDMVVVIASEGLPNSSKNQSLLNKVRRVHADIRYYIGQFPPKRGEVFDFGNIPNIFISNGRRKWKSTKLQGIGYARDYILGVKDLGDGQVLVDTWAVRAPHQTGHVAADYCEGDVLHLSYDLHKDSKGNYYLKPLYLKEVFKEGTAYHKFIRKLLHCFDEGFVERRELAASKNK